jgi:hypothetical protein
MAILGTELNSSLSKGGTNVNTLDAQRSSTLHNLESLTGKAHEGTISTQLSTKGITPAKYVDNKPQ